MAFLFDISIRKASTNSGIGLYVSYLGATTEQKGEHLAPSPPRYLYVLGEAGAINQIPYPVLKNAPKKCPVAAALENEERRLSNPFSTAAEGCGLIDLSNCDVWPVPRNGTFDNVCSIFYGVSADEFSLHLS